MTTTLMIIKYSSILLLQYVAELMELCCLDEPGLSVGRSEAAFSGL